MPVRSSHGVQSTSAIAKERTSVKQNENGKVILGFSHVGDVKLFLPVFVHWYISTVQCIHTCM
jgi:hypothetical protein